MAVMGGDRGRRGWRTGDDSELMVTTAWTIGVPKARHGRLRLMTVAVPLAARKYGHKKTPAHLSVEPGSIRGRVV